MHVNVYIQILTMVFKHVLTLVYIYSVNKYQSLLLCFIDQTITNKRNLS